MNGDEERKRINSAITIIEFQLFFFVFGLEFREKIMENCSKVRTSHPKLRKKSPLIINLMLESSANSMFWFYYLLI